MPRSLPIHTEFIRIRINKEKRDWLKKKAKKTKVTISDVLRGLIDKEMHEN